MVKDKFEIAREIADELMEEIGIPTIIIYPDKEKKIFPTSSKFGGKPYWDNSVPYPTDSDGNKLKLLAQINLAEVSSACGNTMGLLPKEGMLQFFQLSKDDPHYGMDPEDYTNNNRFRVVYHPTINEDISDEDIASIDVPTMSKDCEFDPIYGEIGLDFEAKLKASPDYGDFKKEFIRRAASYGWEIKEPEDMVDPDLLYYCLDDDVSDFLLDYCMENESCLLGYPEFDQSDPRLEDERYARYDTQLFQMYSYEDDEDDDFKSIWGDSGIAHFFINHKDLARRDFSDVMYTWDCF